MTFFALFSNRCFMGFLTSRAELSQWVHVTFSFFVVATIVPSYQHTIVGLKQLCLGLQGIFMNDDHECIHENWVEPLFALITDQTWHRFKKVQETLPRRFIASIFKASQLLRIWKQHIHDANLLSPEVRWGHRHVQDTSLRWFVTTSFILLEVSINRWVHAGHEGMVSNNTWVSNKV